MKKPTSIIFVIFAFSTIFFIAVSIGGMIVAWGRSESDSSIIETDKTPLEAAMSIQLTSEAFASGQSIPAKYSCIGRNVSPPLAWNEPPAGTQSFSLIMDDPDAPMGTWVHWVLYNIPLAKRDLQEDLPMTGKNVDPNAIYVGKNSSGNIGYDGPCPPSG
ncbi:MAG: YbhB/YbcL family Raf kinase inhibitor-like protein, partial [Anaerolineales bacterium]